MSTQPVREKQQTVRGGLHIATIAGVPLIIHYSWLAIFALITANLFIVFGQEPPVPGSDDILSRYLYHPEWGTAERLILALITSVFFFVSVLLHELAHSLLSIRSGIPVHNITLFIFGGASHISQEADKPGKEAAIAVVGPLTSFAIGALCFLLLWAVGDASEHVATALFWLGFVNVSLGVFNLLPGFPLDGGRILRATVWAATRSFDRATRIAAGVGRFIGIGLMVLGGFQVFFGGNLGGLWLVLIGWFLENAAGSSYSQLRLTNALEGVTARDVMDNECQRVPQQLRLDTLVEGYVLPSGKRCFIVSDTDRDLGIITLGGIGQVPRDKWRDTSVADAMVTMAQVVGARPETPAIEILSAMTGRNINQVPVIVDGKIVGMATRERMLNVVRMRLDMGLDQR